MRFYPCEEMVAISKTASQSYLERGVSISLKIPLLIKCRYWATPLSTGRLPSSNFATFSPNPDRDPHHGKHILLCRRPHPSVPSCGPCQRLHEEDRPVQEASGGARVDWGRNRSGVSNPGGAERGSDGEDLGKDRRPSGALSLPSLRPLASLQSTEINDGWSPVWSEGQVRSGQHAGESDL